MAQDAVYWRLPLPRVDGRGIARMCTTAGGKPSARTFIAAKTSILAGQSTPANVGIAVTTNASVAGSANMPVPDGDGGEVVATNGHIPAATSECVAGMKPVVLIMSADGAGHAVGSDPVPRGMCAGGRNLVK